MKQVIGAQGEVSCIAKIDKIPDGVETRKVERTNGHYIVAHSESGHHHVLTDGEVMEQTNNVPSGMKIFYAILNEPAEFVHTAPSPHENYKLDPGIYEFKISREYDPFSEQAKIVAD